MENHLKNIYFLILFVAGIGNKSTAQTSFLTVNPGSTLTVDEATIRIGGAVKSSGSFNASNGTIEMNGAAVQILAGSMFTDKTIKNLIVNNTGTALSVSSLPNDTLKITGALTFGNPISKIRTGDNITMVSDEFGTARVGIVGTGNDILGKVIVEKYINTGTLSGQHGKSWQFLSLATSGQTIKQSWMENGDVPDNYGTMITGAGGSAAGFDLYSATPSMKYYVDTTNTWKGVSGTNELISNTGGYLLFVRGDRSVVSSTAPAKPTVLRSKGPLFIGDQLPINVKANYFQAIGNPYASPIYFSLITKDTSIADAFYIWDPYLHGTYGLGGYQTLSKINKWKPVPGGTNAYHSSVESSIIQSGQAFFVHTGSNNNGTVTIKENCKSEVPRPGFSSRNASNVMGEGSQFLNASLFTNNGIMADGNVVIFDNLYTNNIDRNDIVKMTNSGENFSVKSSGKLYAIEAKSTISINDTIYYNISNLSKTAYQLAFSPDNMETTGLQAFLIDKYLNTESFVSLSDSTFINININSNSLSSAADRFKLVFRQISVLPVTITSITATAKNGNNVIKWSVENQTGIQKYIVEKSIGGNVFAEIDQVNANNSERGNYEIVDKNVINDINFYRIQITGVDGKITYSQIVKVVNGKVQRTVSVYPNPVTGDVIYVQLNNQPSGNYKLRLYNTAGQLLSSKDIFHEQGSREEELKCVNLPKGIYLLQIIKPDGNEVIKINK